MSLKYLHWTKIQAFQEKGFYVQYLMKTEAAIYLNKNEQYLKHRAKKITPFGLYVTYVIFAMAKITGFKIVVEKLLYFVLWSHETSLD